MTEEESIRISRLVAVLDRMAGGGDPSWFREHEHYGDVALSVQAGAGFYSRPQTNGLPIEEYKDVEVAVLVDDKIVRPSRVGLRGFNRLLTGDGDRLIMPHVSQADLAKLREALKRRQERMENAGR